ncbi:unnamed protein product (macronuclear) [Paramecium tetraurelia]|uniref:Steroid dehydrogenase n=1 Tax=Paramecium tetraurelia TaxID=5888 RepID=A0DL31_PARTE|nr:uncharacterized protein GSPATT00018065001 [Paramecium tetraurelia]CAK83748.1 unnamed protein product [Paramecium tetraurelia]|eukprot:XP_001451145.1 hypothetical protein (macronuclear) [Paramecium tetraurelia strain d4-2]
MELLIFQRLIRLHKEFIHLYYSHMHKRSKLVSFFIGVASLYLIKTLAKLLWLTVPRVRSNLISKYGRNSWAVVTGGSDGIGKEFCIELAKQGFNIVVVARNEQKMNELCAQLQNSHVETKTIVVDFSQGHSVEFYEKVKSELRYLDISILVNNVGMSEGTLFAYEKMDNILKILRVNALSTLMMTRILINKLECRQNKSAVITLSSALAYLPCPYLTVYSCTKSFTHYFTQSLGLTYKNTHFLSVTPLGVRTKMLAMKQGFEVIEPNQLVKNVLDDLRVGKQTSYGWNVHKGIINYVLWRNQNYRDQVKVRIGNNLRDLYLSQK